MNFDTTFVSISTTKMLRFVVSAEAEGLNFTVDPVTFEVPELLGKLRFGPGGYPTSGTITYPYMGPL